MSERTRAAQVGLLFMLSIAVLIWGVLWFKDFSVGERSYDLRVEFPNTSGLIKGDQVEVKGVPSGEVSGIDYVDGRAIVTIQLRKDIVLHQGTEAAIQNAGLMGQKVVAVDPGPMVGPPLTHGALIQGRYESGMPELMGGVGDILGTFERLALRVDTLLVGFDREKQEDLARTLANTEKITGHLAVLLERNVADLDTVISGMAATMGELRIALEGRGETLGGLLDNTAVTTTRLDSTLTTLDRTVTRLDRILAGVEDGDGSVGRLLQDKALYDEMVTTLQDAKTLLKDVRENPRRYFKVSIF